MFELWVEQKRQFFYKWIFHYFNSLETNKFDFSHPEPVSASPMMSFPLSATGIASR
jgi:hypothetical protein